MLLQNKDLALLLPGLHCGNFLNQFYDTETGANLPEVVPEDAFKFYVATMVLKNSPLIDRINEITLQCIKSDIGTYHVKLALAENDDFGFKD